MLPKEKQTALGLYVIPKEAYDKWKGDPEKVKILDVRTNEEFLFVGHAPMAQCASHKGRQQQESSNVSTQSPHSWAILSSLDHRGEPRFRMLNTSDEQVCD
jgi:hypothetical protein